MAFLVIAFVVTTVPTDDAWAQGGGICRICGRSLSTPPEPRCRAIGKVVVRARLEVRRTPVAAERVPADISEVLNLGRAADIRDLVEILKESLPPHTPHTLTTQGETAAMRRKAMLHTVGDPGSVKAIVDADSVKLMADGDAILEVLNTIKDPNGHCKGRTFAIVLAHKGLGHTDFLDMLLKEMERDEFRGQHVLVITCVPGQGPFGFDADTLRRWVQWQHRAISFGGASSVLVPTSFVSPLAFTLAMLRMCLRPDIAGAPTSPLDMLNRLYDDSAERLDGVLKKLKGGTGEAVLRNDLQDAFGSDVLKFFVDPIRPGRIGDILDFLKTDVEQFLEFVDASQPAQGRTAAA
jgi:hypothetical protein